MDENFIKIIVPPNTRIFSDYDTGIEMTAREEYYLPQPGQVLPRDALKVSPQALKSANVKAAFLQGQLRVIEGDLQFQYKDSLVKIHGEPGGNTFIELNAADGSTTTKSFLPKIEAKPVTTEPIEKKSTEVVTEVSPQPTSFGKKKKK